MVIRIKDSYSYSSDNHMIIMQLRLACGGIDGSSGFSNLIFLRLKLVEEIGSDTLMRLQ